MEPISKTEDRKQKTEDSKIMAKDTANFFYNGLESSTNQHNFKKQTCPEQRRMEPIFERTKLTQASI